MFSISALVRIPVGITSSTVGLKMCEISASIKSYKSIIKKKRKNLDKIVLLGKNKLDTIKILISKAVINSYITHILLFSK